MKKTLLGRVSKSNVMKANLAMVNKSAITGKYSTHEIKVKFGDNSKVISNKITLAKINEAWSKVIENEKL